MNYALKILTLILLQFSLLGIQVETFYGHLDVNEPVLIELIESSPFQRLKHIKQYGVSYYTSWPDEYTRYDHSLGVFALLRKNNCSLHEQIAGLLHDVSHTVFSHVGDWLFQKQYLEKDYQNSIHLDYLEKSGLATILKKYQITPEEIEPLEELFPALEQKAPNLCADRIDYNIQGAYYQNFITKDEALEIFNDLQFINGQWCSTRADKMKKLVLFSLYMTENCWGNVSNYLESQWLAEAIWRAVEINLITLSDIHFSYDAIIWHKLFTSDDTIISNHISKILHSRLYFKNADTHHSSSTFVIKSKFRGINPLILTSAGIRSILELDADLRETYEKTKERIQKGWLIEIIHPEKSYSS